jgi:hypothetical protein
MILVVDPNVIDAKFKQVFSVLRLDQFNLLVLDAAEESFDVHVGDLSYLVDPIDAQSVQHIRILGYITIVFFIRLRSLRI